MFFLLYVLLCNGAVLAHVPAKGLAEYFHSTNVFFSGGNGSPIMRLLHQQHVCIKAVSMFAEMHGCNGSLMPLFGLL
jgi:hypothetical protein